ncbi:unnamed protein product [Ectocarpus sp. CCAP 1310/34]|nr:unnamed protein product [Ectocarpus sp. CCAP 1310/34]
MLLGFKMPSSRRGRRKRERRRHNQKGLFHFNEIAMSPAVG